MEGLAGELHERLVDGLGEATAGEGVDVLPLAGGRGVLVPPHRVLLADVEGTLFPRALPDLGGQRHIAAAHPTPRRHHRRIGAGRRGVVGALRGATRGQRGGCGLLRVRRGALGSGRRISRHLGRCISRCCSVRRGLRDRLVGDLGDLSGRCLRRVVLLCLCDLGVRGVLSVRGVRGVLHRRGCGRMPLPLAQVRHYRGAAEVLDGLGVPQGLVLCLALRRGFGGGDRGVRGIRHVLGALGVLVLPGGAGDGGG